MIVTERKSGLSGIAHQWKGDNLWEIESSFLEPAELSGRVKNGEILFDVRTSSGTFTAAIMPGQWCVMLTNKRMSIFSDDEFKKLFAEVGS